MAGRIARRDIDEIRSRIDISEVIGQYVTLKSAGIGSLKGLCPFHDERSPSFHVRPQLGYYHCFGCGEGGDVFTFLQKMDHVTFTEAVEQLADRLGYELHYEDGGPDLQARGRRARILEANEAARSWFAQQLNSPEAKVARAELLRRDFDSHAAHEFHMGYAPKGWNGLRDHLQQRGFTNDELIAAGLVSQGQRGVYDRFRGRLMWPIIDLTGRTIGFGARRLYDDDQGPKYLNTPETDVYHKAKVLYGLDLAKRAIAKKRQVVVVEGYTDVMACHLAGVDTAVATCGTAFGPGHIEVIRRVLADDASKPAEVIFTFDPDEAGQKAALRAFAEEQRFVAQTYVAIAPDGLDPSDLRMSRGDQAVRSMITAKTPLFEFAMRQVIKRFDLNTVEGQVQALQQAAPIVASLRNRALQPGYARVLAGLVGADPDEALRAVRAAERDRSRRSTASPDVPDAPAVSAQQVGSGFVRAGDAEQRADAVSAPAPAVPVHRADLPMGSQHARREVQLAEALLQVPELCPPDLRSRVEQLPVNEPRLRQLLEVLFSVPNYAEQKNRVETVGERVAPELQSLVGELAMTQLPVSTGAEAAAYAREVLTRYLLDRLDQRIRELLGRLSRGAAVAPPDQVRNVQRMLVDLEQERRDLQESIA
ncbi:MULTISPECIES: DNA primase [unclassified Pseudoclavibacter]|uniref:DNA primase n=1 Tax=unclassified Pseudoclavibacter TaxID=2615177 RepID=UPI0013012B38|nr:MULTISPECIES: DNA primase [unclassified Pseudoclavibacter]KAB1645486.1 DNA primase [Pseudoclavibacter sp. CFCC 14310]KAB1646055.1 DNA primase [Pseudoclavibacter sp. CFCC 14310]KAB1663637.1 DNA primase [Pseudoclavibacter sp. CFCC 13611]KAB1664614.1 DNA primase [Pseudoclavibacter sp. CFCC 13611]